MPGEFLNPRAVLSTHLEVKVIHHALGWNDLLLMLAQENPSSNIVSVPFGMEKSRNGDTEIIARRNFEV
ncbi:unnamed protein product [Boreogadus saida]